jgi:hypothetical protein
MKYLFQTPDYIVLARVVIFRTLLTSKSNYHNTRGMRNLFNSSVGSNWTSLMNWGAPPGMTLPGRRMVSLRKLILDIV